MYPKPKTRGECKDGPRPCPFVSCRHHLALDIGETTGHVWERYPGKDLAELEHTCALDVADRGPHRLIELGRLLNVSRERIRQVEAGALHALNQQRRRLGLHAPGDGPTFFESDYIGE